MPLTQVATDGEVVDVVEDEPLVAEVNVLDAEPELPDPVETDVRYVLQLAVHHESPEIGSMYTYTITLTVYITIYDLNDHYHLRSRMTSSELHCLSSTWLNEGRLGKRVSLARFIGIKMSCIFGSFKTKYV